MPRIVSRVYIILLLIISILSISVYLYYDKGNPINTYFNNKAENFFKLETLKLDGRYRSNKEQILSTLSLKKDSPIFSILKKCELSNEDFFIIKKYCDKKKIIFFSTPFDIK